MKESLSLRFNNYQKSLEKNLRALSFDFFVISTCAIFGASISIDDPLLLFVFALVINV